MSNLGITQLPIQEQPKYLPWKMFSLTQKIYHGFPLSLTENPHCLQQLPSIHAPLPPHSSPLWSDQSTPGQGTWPQAFGSTQSSLCPLTCHCALLCKCPCVVEAITSSIVIPRHLDLDSHNNHKLRPRHSMASA
jgi:hypothetical protein